MSEGSRIDDQNQRAQVSLKYVPARGLLVPFVAIWSGISIGGIYGSQVAQGKFNLLQSLFGLPFLLGTLFLVPLTLMMIFGKVTVQVIGADGMIFTGIGPFGWRRRFNWFDVKAVRVETYWSGGRNQTQQTRIVLEGSGKLRFASGLRLQRQEFLAGVLRQELKNRPTP